VLVDPPLSGVRNMARDHALAEGLEAGTGVLRLYRWATPTVSFGRNEPVHGRYDRDRARLRGIEFVRRPTGGRAVLHDRELTYALVAPYRGLRGPRETYGAVNAGLVKSLASLGVRAELAPGDGATPPDAGPCFRRAAAGEVTVGGRKLVGSAQVRIGGALLQHGSLLLGPGQGVLEELGAPPAGGGGQPTSLLEVLGAEPAMERVVAALLGGLEAELGGSWEPPVEGTAGAFEEKRVSFYHAEAWTWRR